VAQGFVGLRKLWALSKKAQHTFWKKVNSAEREETVKIQKKKKGFIRHTKSSGTGSKVGEKRIGGQKRLTAFLDNDPCQTKTYQTRLKST